jgi:hypothetical protein
MPRPFPVFSEADNQLFTVDPLRPGVFWARSWQNAAAGQLTELEHWDNSCNPAFLDAALPRLPDGRWCRCSWETVRGQRLWVGRLVTARRAAGLLAGPDFALPQEWQERLAADCQLEGQLSAASPPGPAGPAAAHRSPGTVNQRMLEELQRNPQSAGWTQREWAAYLRCSAAAVAKAPAWQAVKTTRALAETDRLDRQRRRRD